MKLTDLSPGDRLVSEGDHKDAADGSVCIKAGEIVTVEADFMGGLFVRCSVGEHYLDQHVLDEDGEIIGLVPAPKN